MDPKREPYWVTKEKIQRGHDAFLPWLKTKRNKVGTTQVFERQLLATLVLRVSACSQIECSFYLIFFPFGMFLF